MPSGGGAAVVQCGWVVVSKVWGFHAKSIVEKRGCDRGCAVLLSRLGCGARIGSGESQGRKWPFGGCRGVPELRQSPVAQANRGVSRAVLESLPLAVLESRVLIHKSYRPGMPIVYPDGTLVEGQSAEVQARRALCSGGIYGPPGGSWGTVSKCANGVFGSPGYRRGYSWWNAVAGSVSSGCVQGRGFKKRGNATWYQVDYCGQSGSGSVPWQRAGQSGRPGTDHFPVRLSRGLQLIEPAGQQSPRATVSSRCAR